MFEGAYGRWSVLFFKFQKNIEELYKSGLEKIFFQKIEKITKNGILVRIVK